MYGPMWKYGQSTSAVASAYSEPHLNDLLFIAVASEARKGLRENKTLEPFFWQASEANHMELEH